MAPSLPLPARRLSAGKVLILCGASLGLVVAPVAAWADGLLILGTSDEGGTANAYETIIDLGSGHGRTTQVHGMSSSQHGYDGHFWNFLNGASNTIDMPSALEDRRAESWIEQWAWRITGKPHEMHRRVILPQTSPIELTFDPKTGQVGSASFEGDYGPVTIAFGDWRPVGRYRYPFRQQVMSDLDGRRVDQAQSVRLLSRVDPDLLARPVGPVLARLGAPAVTVPFQSVGQRKTHILVAASINGISAPFVFDTGGANILTIEAAKRLQIASSGGLNVGGVGAGTENGGFGQVRSVSIGRATLNDQSFIIIPSPFPPSNGKSPEAAGIVGYEFLANFVTTIDYKAETMTFRDKVPADQKGVRVALVSDGHTIAVTAKVDGKPATVRFDTGDGGTLTLFPAFIQAAGIDTGNGPVKVGGSGAGGEAKARSGKIDDFSVAGVDFPGLPVQFSEMSRGAFASRHLAGNLGAGVIRCFRVTFDYPHHQLWLEPQLDTPGCAATAAKSTKTS